MLRSNFLIAGFAATAIALSLAACGSDETKNTGSTTDKPGIQPPEPGPAKACTGSDLVMAADTLLLGETRRDGTSDSANGWKEYGYDLDGRISTKESTGLCKPAAGAAPFQVYPDGKDGIDNSFGKNIMPVILGLISNPSTEASAAIAEGDFTLMLAMKGVGTETDCNPFVTKLYAGSSLGAAPKWDGTDMWPVVQEILNDPADIESAKIQFPESYLVNNTWVSGSKGKVSLSLAIQGFTLSLDINSALISLNMTPDANDAKQGTIAGILDTEALIDALLKIAGGFDTQFCDPNSTTVQSILNQIRQASDIMADGSQDPSKECNGISIGLGFTAKQVQLGPIADKVPPGSDPCQGGTGGGGTGGGGTGGSGTGGSGGGK